MIKLPHLVCDWYEYGKRLISAWLMISQSQKKGDISAAPFGIKINLGLFEF